jgi:hypothetical protein
MCPSCGQAARYGGRHAKTFQSALGELRLERAYYRCEACGGGFCPRDRALGLEDASLSPAVTRMVGQVGAMVSFAEGSELMRELAGITVDPKQVERTAERLGREIAQDERTVVEPGPPSAPTMYLDMDGTAVPMRPSELEGREGKQPDGSAKTREVKLATVWSAEGGPGGVLGPPGRFRGARPRKHRSRISATQLGENRGRKLEFRKGYEILSALQERDSGSRSMTRI